MEEADDEVLLSVIGVFLFLSPFLQNSIIGLFVQTSCFAFFPVSPSLSWSCEILSSFSGSAVLAHHPKTRNIKSKLFGFFRLSIKPT